MLMFTANHAAVSTAWILIWAHVWHELGGNGDVCFVRRINPTGEMFFDGITLGPYDVLFVKMKSLMLEGKTSGTTKALQYQGWMEAVVRPLALSPSAPTPS